jgi:hypothetical protein
LFFVFSLGTFRTDVNIWFGKQRESGQYLTAVVSLPYYEVRKP